MKIFLFFDNSFNTVFFGFVFFFFPFWRSSHFCLQIESFLTHHYFFEKLPSEQQMIFLILVSSFSGWALLLFFLSPRRICLLLCFSSKNEKLELLWLSFSSHTSSEYLYQLGSQECLGVHVRSARSIFQILYYFYLRKSFSLFYLYISCTIL